MDDKIIQIDTDNIFPIYQKYSTIPDILNDIKITIPDKINSVYNNACNISNLSFEQSKKAIVKIANNTQNMISQTMHALNDIDGGIDVSMYGDAQRDSKEYTEARHAIIGEYNLVKANNDFFQKLIDDGKLKQGQDDRGVYVEYGYKNADGSEVCKYYYERNQLKVSKVGKNGEKNTYSCKVEFYVPNGYSYDDLTGLNTFTTFNSPYSSKKNSSNHKEARHISASANSIVINVLWETGGTTTSTQKEKEEHAKGVAAPATRLINYIKEGTNAKGNTQNIISGGSRFGAYSLQLAADNGDLYDTVICVNNALIVKGVTGRPDEKSQLTPEQVRNLDGKNVLFVNTRMDTNPVNNKNKKFNSDYKSASRKFDLSTGYTYTGIDYLAKNCPNANIGFASDNEIWLDAYEVLDEKYSNVTVDRSLIDEINYTGVVKNYNGVHGQYQPIIQGAMRYDFNRNVNNFNDGLMMKSSNEDINI